MTDKSIYDEFREPSEDDKEMELCQQACDECCQWFKYFTLNEWIDMNGDIKFICEICLKLKKEVDYEKRR